MINELRRKIAANKFEYSCHAVAQSILRPISVQELRESFSSGEIIEDYPDDKYEISCLISGWTQAQHPLHVQCSYPSRALVKIMTLYEPDPNLWVDFKMRQRNE
jgi:hypothetical protein